MKKMYYLPVHKREGSLFLPEPFKNKKCAGKKNEHQNTVKVKDIYLQPIRL